MISLKFVQNIGCGSPGGGIKKYPQSVSEIMYTPVKLFYFIKVGKLQRYVCMMC